MDGIKFGTDGWRAIVGKDFNKDNAFIPGVYQNGFYKEQRFI